jgi:hypothetical protein
MTTKRRLWVIIATAVMFVVEMSRLCSPIAGTTGRLSRFELTYSLSLLAAIGASIIRNECGAGHGREALLVGSLGI